MKYTGIKFLALYCAAASLVAFAPAAFAEPQVKFTGNLKGQAIFGDDLDLETSGANKTDSQSLELKGKLEGSFNDDVSFMLEARGVKNYGEQGSFDTETGEFSSRDDYLELRQYWVDYHGFSGMAPLSIRAGRQRFKEDYGLWWNRDFDAVRVSHNATLLKSFVAVGQNLGEYRTSGDAFNNDDEDIFRLLGETSWQWKPDHYIQGRLLYQNDHSGLESVGDRLDADDFDSRDADIVWLGLRLSGDVPALTNASAVSKAKYRVDLIGMAGNEDRLTTSAVGTNERLVTGETDADLRAWAFDAGLDIPVSGLASVEPVFHIGYAYGSGDGNPNDGDDHAFRQTDLDSNSSHLAGFSSSVNHYGSVLRPDLSNIHIATLGVNVPVTNALDVAGFYHYYALAEADGSVAASGIDAPVNGDDRDLGHGLDIMFNLDVAKQFNYDPVVADQINLKTTLGGFVAGSAYGAAEDETALRGQIDLNIRF